MHSSSEHEMVATDRKLQHTCCNGVGEAIEVMPYSDGIGRPAGRSGVFRGGSRWRRFALDGGGQGIEQALDPFFGSNDRFQGRRFP